MLVQNYEQVKKSQCDPYHRWRRSPQAGGLPDGVNVASLGLIAAAT